MQVKRRAFAALVALLMGVLPALAAQPGLVKSEFIYETAPFPECHASTIAETTNGLAVAWFGGTRERHPDVGIWLARLVDGKWTAPVEVANGVESPEKRHPCWNPVLFQPKAGPLLLFYKVGPSPATWWGMITTSDDGGRTWSARRRLPNDMLGPIKNKPVEFADGTILCGSSTENDGWRVHFEWTKDLGRTWEKTGPINDGKGLGVIQPALLQLDDSTVVALMRSRQGRIFTARTQTRGKAWSAAEPTGIPNPNSGIDAVTLRDGRQVLVYNHTGRGRSPLNVAVSKNARDWQAALVLEDEPGKEFSYPAIIQTRDGLVHATWTWKRQRIRHAVLNPARFEPREIVEGKWPL